MVFVASSAASTGVTDAGVYLGMVLLLGLAAQWLAWRFRIPSILFLLLFGFLSGLVVRPDEIISESLLFPLVSLAVGVILFEGGLTLRFSELKGVTQPLVRLCTWGAGVTWVLASLAAYFLAGLPWLVAILFGAILVVTGPTVILPLLRFIKPNRSVGAIAKWEGIVIDPVGAVLAVLVLQMVLSDTLGKAAQSAVVVIGQTVVVGFGLAFVAAKLLELFLKRHWIPDYLHALTFLTTGTVVFVAANTLQTESGLVAVTTLGILLANQRSVSVREVLEFKEHLRVLLISVLFIVLSSRVQLGELAALGWRGPAFVAALIFLVRPLSIFLSTLGSSLGWKEKVLLCFLAPRGIVAAAVASIFALEIAHVAAEQGNEALQQAAQQLVPLTFSVIVGTVTFYGLTAGPVARRLGLASRNPQGVLFAGTPRWAIEAGKLLKEEGFQVLYVDTS
ncbi:MAG: sodium:proton antiporter, partial [Verrucomicrobiota bacterium]